MGVTRMVLRSILQDPHRARSGYFEAVVGVASLATADRRIDMTLHPVLASSISVFASLGSRVTLCTFTLLSFATVQFQRAALRWGQDTLPAREEPS
jgi:hypothetical protein